MRMLGNNLLVKKLTKEQLGTIIMPDAVAEEWSRGKVISVGAGCTKTSWVIEDGKRVPIDYEVSLIKEGDTIVFLAPPPHIGEYPSIDNDGNIAIPETYVCAIED